MHFLVIFHKTFLHRGNIIMETRSSTISRFRIDHAVHPPHYSMHSAHSHTYFELFYLMHGSCTISIDDKSFTLSEGNIIFIPADSIHPNKTGEDASIYGYDIVGYLQFADIMFSTFSGLIN